MSDGLVQFMHRKKVNETDENGQEDFSGKNANMKYMNFTKFEPGEGDVVIKKVQKRKINQL